MKSEQKPPTSAQITQVLTSLSICVTHNEASARRGHHYDRASGFVDAMQYPRNTSAPSWLKDGRLRAFVLGMRVGLWLRDERTIGGSRPAPGMAEPDEADRNEIADRDAAGVA